MIGLKPGTALDYTATFGWKTLIIRRRITRNKLAVLQYEELHGVEPESIGQLAYEVVSVHSMNERDVSIIIDKWPADIIQDHVNSGHIRVVNKVRKEVSKEIAKLIVMELLDE